MKQAVVLLSGGLDSATILYIAKEKGFKCFCIGFDYNQRHKKEINAARKIANKSKTKLEIIKFDLPWRGSALLDKKIAVPKKNTSKIPSTYVPARNIIFLSFALSFAETINAEAIFIGANAVDFSGYPDCRPEFYRAMNRVIIAGTKAGAKNKKIKIETPLINKSKAEIIKIGLKLKVPYQLSWSCYKGSRIPCGVCDSCYLRAKGFREAGLEDPILT